MKVVGNTVIQPFHKASCHCGAVELELSLPNGIEKPRRCDCSICRRKGAIGVLEEDESGRSSVTKVTLRPDIVFSGIKIPTAKQLDKLHHLAHKNCFIANSVKTDIVVETKA